MMPASLTRWLRQVLAGLGMIPVIIVLVLWPARQVLLPLWPEKAEETVYQTASGDSRRLFHGSRSEPGYAGRLIRRDRPLNLVRVEERDGSRFHAYLAGVRPDEGALVADRLPEWIRAEIVAPPAGSSEVVVLIDADGERFDLPVDAIRRIYRPNQLALVSRLRLSAERFVRVAGQVADLEPAGTGRFIPGRGPETP